MSLLTPLQYSQREKEGHSQHYGQQLEQSNASLHAQAEQIKQLEAQLVEVKRTSVVERQEALENLEQELSRARYSAEEAQKSATTAETRLQALEEQRQVVDSAYEQLMAEKNELKEVFSRSCADLQVSVPKIKVTSTQIVCRQRITRSKSWIVC